MIPETELIEFVFEHLCEHHAEAVAGFQDEEIRQRAARAVARARRYGFQKESSFVAFAALMVVVAPNFDDQPKIRAALMDPRLLPDLRIEKLMENTAEEDWDAAAAAANPALWS